MHPVCIKRAGCTQQTNCDRMVGKIHIAHKIVISFLIAIIMDASVFASDANGFVEITGFGDSITSGRPYSDIIGGGRENYGGYEPFLKQLLNGANVVAYVYNWGFGGETTPVGLYRIESVLSAQLFWHVPTV